MVAAHGLDAVVQVTGHPTWTFLQLRPTGPYDALTLKTLFLQECLARGVLTLGTHNVCHEPSVIPQGRPRLATTLRPAAAALSP